MDTTRYKDSIPEPLDRLVEVMRHFHCGEPRELENLLRLPEDSLLGLFRERSRELPETVVRSLEAAGIRREFILRGSGMMLSDKMDAGRLRVMKRHAAHLLNVICGADRALGEGEGFCGIPPHVTDSRIEPVVIEEELIKLLIEALSSKSSRESLLRFIRSEAANRAASHRGSAL